MPEITVIVPIYNVERFLPCCIDSILAQSFADFQFILVDDGSPDNCGGICDEYAQKDSRIHVIHQKNKGLSGARNAGIDIAEGDYIAFIDSDDLVTCDYLENLLWVIKETNADIAVCQMYEFEEEKDISTYAAKRSEVKEYNVYDNKEACIELYKGNKYVSVSACTKLFRAELIANIRFPVGRLHEDEAFTPLVYYKAKKIVSIENAMYCYRERAGSIMRNSFSVKRYDDLWAIDSCIDFFQSNHEDEIVKVAKRQRQKLLAVYAICARRDKVAVPAEYRMSMIKALCYLRKNMPDSKFEYYLAMVNPKFVIVNEYITKIKQVFGIKNNLM